LFDRDIRDANEVLQRANKGILITTSTFSDEVTGYPSNIPTKIALIDGERLAELMIDHDIGVTKEATYDIKRIDNDYLSEE
jgi:restriction system protein